MRLKLGAGVGAIGLSILFAGCAAGASETFSVSPHTPPPPKQLVAHAMLQEAKAGKFQPPPNGYQYAAPVECRVDRDHGFHGSAIYLCKITIAKLKDTHLYEWGAWYRGALHTHNTDPSLIKTITGPFDPPF